MSQTEVSPKKSGGRPIVYIVVAIIVIALVYYATTAEKVEQVSSTQPVAEEPAPSPESESASSPSEPMAPVSAQDSQVKPDWY